MDHLRTQREMDAERAGELQNQSQGQRGGTEVIASYIESERPPHRKLVARTPAGLTLAELETIVSARLARQCLFPDAELIEAILGVAQEVIAETRAEAEQQRMDVLVGLARRLNKPMVEKIRAAAADTSPNWDVTATVYPPSARDLIAFIDAVLASSPEAEG